MWLTSFVEMALEPFSGGCGWGLPLLYKTWNIARRAKVTAEDKALNVRRTENLCTASSVLWKTNSGYCLLSNLNTKKFFSTAQALLCERQQAPWASQILLWRWKGGSISWLLLEPVTVPCSQPAPSSPCSLLDELELKPKHRMCSFQASPATGGHSASMGWHRIHHNSCLQPHSASASIPKPGCGWPPKNKNFPKGKAGLNVLILDFYLQQPGVAGQGEQLQIRY